MSRTPSYLSQAGSIGSALVTHPGRRLKSQESSGRIRPRTLEGFSLIGSRSDLVRSHRKSSTAPYAVGHRSGDRLTLIGGRSFAPPAVLTHPRWPCLTKGHVLTVDVSMKELVVLCGENSMMVDDDEVLGTRPGAEVAIGGDQMIRALNSHGHDGCRPCRCPFTDRRYQYGPNNYRDGALESHGDTPDLRTRRRTVLRPARLRAEEHGCGAVRERLRLRGLGAVLESSGA